MVTMPKTHAKMGQEMAHCLELCQQCHNACSGVVSYGLQHLSEPLLRLLQDCAEICETSADFILRSSEFHAQTCGLCAEICLKCAAACEEFPQDSRLQECARLCRHCAEACQMMLAMAVSR